MDRSCIRELESLESRRDIRPYSVGRTPYRCPTFLSSVLDWTPGPFHSGSYSDRWSDVFGGP